MSGRFFKLLCVVSPVVVETRIKGGVGLSVRDRGGRLNCRGGTFEIIFVVRVGVEGRGW